MNMKKKLVVLGMAAVMTAGFSMTSFAGEWKQDQVGWWYQNEDGSYAKDGWAHIDNVWYWFDEAGYMETGWISDNGNYYYLVESGGMAANTDLVIDGLHYRFGSDGAMLDDWFFSNSISDYSIYIPDGSYFYEDVVLDAMENSYDFYAQIDGNSALMPSIRVGYDGSDDAKLSEDQYRNESIKMFEESGYIAQDYGKVVLADGREYMKIGIQLGTMHDDFYIRRLEYEGYPIYMHIALAYTNDWDKARVEAILNSLYTYY